MRAGRRPWQVSQRPTGDVKAESAGLVIAFRPDSGQHGEEIAMAEKTLCVGGRIGEPGCGPMGELGRLRTTLGELGSRRVSDS